MFILPELAVKSGSEEAEQAVSEVITEDTKKYLKNFEDKVAQVDKFSQDSIKDYGNHDLKLKEDLKTLGSSTLEVWALINCAFFYAVRLYSDITLYIR